MGGLDWSALETTAEIIGWQDIEMLVVLLATIRDYQDEQRNGDS